MPILGPPPVEQAAAEPFRRPRSGRSSSLISEKIFIGTIPPTNAVTLLVLKE
jgi:hypothetical protein